VVGNRYATTKLEGVGEVDGEMVEAQVDRIPLNVRSLTLGARAAGPEPRCGADEMRDIVLGLAGQLRAADIGVGVLQVADGLLQRETNIVLRALPAWLGPAKCVLAAKESLAAVVGVMHLARMGHSVAAVSGEVTNSPLACREIVSVRDASCVRTADLGVFVESMLGTRAHHYSPAD
jgi:hypothetical protein